MRRINIWKVNSIPTKERGATIHLTISKNKEPGSGVIIIMRVKNWWQLYLLDWIWSKGTLVTSIGVEFPVLPDLFCCEARFLHQPYVLMGSVELGLCNQTRLMSHENHILGINNQLYFMIFWIGIITNSVIQIHSDEIHMLCLNLEDHSCIRAQCAWTNIWSNNGAKYIYIYAVSYTHLTLPTTCGG